MHLLRRAIDGQLDPRLRRQGSFVLYRHAVGSQRGIPARIVAVGIVAVERLHLRYARSDSGRAEPAAAAGRRPRAGRQTAARRAVIMYRRRYRECTAHSPARCAAFLRNRNGSGFSAGHGENIRPRHQKRAGDGLEIAGGDLPGHIRQRMTKSLALRDVGKSTHAVLRKRCDINVHIPYPEVGAASRQFLRGSCIFRRFCVIYVMDGGKKNGDLPCGDFFLPFSTRWR